MPKPPASKRTKVADSSAADSAFVAREPMGSYSAALAPAPAMADLQRVMRIQSGLTSRALERLEAVTGLDDADAAWVLGISLRTLQRKRTQARLDPQLSDRVLQLEDLYAYGTDVFGSLERLWSWLKEPNLSLEQRRPLDVLNTQAGVELIETLLGRIEHGVLA